MCPTPTHVGTTLDAYERIAERWHACHNSDSWWVEPLQYFCDLVPKGGLVLDAGCGGGTKAKFITRESGRNLNVVGFDGSRNKVLIARREVPEAVFAVMRFDQFGMVAKRLRFDGLVSHASLLHLKKREAKRALRRMVGSLNPGGFSYVALKVRRSDEPEEVERAEQRYDQEFTRFFSYYSHHQARDLCLRSGLSIVAWGVRRVEDRDWVYVIGRKL